MMKKRYRLLTILLVCTILMGLFALYVNATEMKSGIGIVAANSLRLRSAPSTDADVIDTAYYGDAVVIIRRVDDWYLVNYNLNIGYMHADYLIVKDRENVTLGYASFDSATNVRSGPGTEYDLVKQAPAAETCFIIGFNCGWYKVSFNGDIGYVRSDLLTLLEKPYCNSGSAAYVADTSSSSSASSSSGSSSGSASYDWGASATVYNGSLGSSVVSTAMQYLGYPYTYGGASPATGFDCSGFVSYIYSQYGYSIGRTSQQQLSNGSYVAYADLQPGDIVLFERTYASSEWATHSGIYIGSGQFIHAANSGKGVVINNLSDSYYASRFICGRRIG